MLNREFMLELIEALESGQYKKGKRCLRTKNDEYCCLGVACDLFSKKGKGSWGAILEDIANDEMIEMYEYRSGELYESHNGYPPLSLRREMGFQDGDFMHRLANINDENDTFAPVVEAIKAKLQEEAHA